MLTVVVDDHVRREDLLLHCIPLGVQTHLVDLPVDASSSALLEARAIRRANSPSHLEKASLLSTEASARASTTSMSSRLHRVACSTASRVVKGSTASQVCDDSCRLKAVLRAELGAHA